MVVPSGPTTDLVIRKTCYPFSILECTLYPVSATRHLGKSLYAGIRWSIGELILYRLVSIIYPNDQPYLISGKLINHWIHANTREYTRYSTIAPSVRCL